MGVKRKETVVRKKANKEEIGQRKDKRNTEKRERMRSDKKKKCQNEKID